MAEGEAAVRAGLFWEDVRYGPDGLCPVVVQSVGDNRVLMLAWADRDAVRRTVQERRAWFWSRSRGAPWRKGETSGNVLDVEQVCWDCDADALLYRVRPTGPTCHTGHDSCFYRGEDAPGRTDRRASSPPDGPAVSTETLGAALDELVATVAERARDLPPGSYTADLLRAGPARALQKLGEEAVEAVIAGTQPDAPRLAAEAADLLFHLVVALAATGVPAADVAAELARRRRRPSRADG